MQVPELEASAGWTDGVLAAPTDDGGWVIVEEGFTLTREHELESLFAVANGHVGTRGSLAEGSPMSAPATYVAGLFDTAPGSTPALLVLPDWTRLSFKVDGYLLRLDVGRVLEHRRVLDLRQGMIWREWRHEDSAGRITRLRGLRFASMADAGLLVQSVSLTPENYSGAVVIDAMLSGQAMRRTSGGATAALAPADEFMALRGDGRVCALDPPQSVEIELGETYRLDRVVAVSTSLDNDQPEIAAATRADGLRKEGIRTLFTRHRKAWEDRWAASDIRIEGDERAQRALRFAAYHLLSAADADNDRVSIGARGLTGSGYNGHVFWDADIFMLPFFTLTWPEAARSLVMYRRRTLQAARAKAERLGERGAFYPWESADTGEDVTPTFGMEPGGRVIPIVLSEQEQHISADVAYGAWTYWRATGDDQFLLEAGAEILIETARFWVGRAQTGDDGLRHICGVVGPDEFHEGVDDDAYTNGMAQWNVRTAADTARMIAERWPERWHELSRTSGIEPAEIQSWDAVAQEIYTGLDPETGLIEQFQGYFGLEDIDLTAYEPRNAPIEMLLGRKRLQASQIIKQPDVLMLFHLLWDSYPPEVRRANFDYYAPRCAHGSSLSPATHALVAARLGRMDLAERYFRQASEIDLADNMGNAAAGVHAAALGGLWQAAVFGFGGLRLMENGPVLNPSLPPHWRELSFRIRLRGEDHDLHASGSETTCPEPPEAAR